MDYKLGEIYYKNGVYLVVTEIKNGHLSESIPLSRWVLQNYIGTTQ